MGGAVRDEIMQREVKEKDWVVVGATPEEMLRLGFRQVGKDFPVFLHPETHEEYALARTERKIGRGYTGFEFNAAPTVTLTDDLIRRDLTINAIAKNASGKKFDPFHGEEDIQNKILRHVSDAFVEDPVRILRVARFAARFGDFTVAEETIELMKRMVHSGEVNALVAERVWKEWERALAEKNPERFFEVLGQCEALKILFPAIKISDKNTAALQRSVKLTEDSQIHFAVLLHDLSEKEIIELCERYRVPSDYRDLALLAAKHINHYKNIYQQLSIVKLFREMDAFRREQRIQKFLLACRAITQDDKAAEIFRSYLAAAKSVDTQKISSEFKGKEIAEQLDLAREQEIEKIRRK